jgi:four helix bundle protein
MDTDIKNNLLFYEPIRKNYDLEVRTFEFAKRVRDFVKKVKYTIPNSEDIKQLIRSSGSIGANYIEANGALGKKDFLMHIKISKKESKESHYWLRLIDIENNKILQSTKESLINEAQELVKIFGSIINKTT